MLKIRAIMVLYGMSFDGFNMLFIMALCCFYPFAELSEKVKIRKYFYSPRIGWGKMAIAYIKRTLNFVSVYVCLATT